MGGGEAGGRLTLATHQFSLEVNVEFIEFGPITKARGPGAAPPGGSAATRWEAAWVVCSQMVSSVRGGARVKGTQSAEAFTRVGQMSLSISFGLEDRWVEGYHGATCVSFFRGALPGEAVA